MKYEYRGPVPVADEAGELVHPLDVRDFETPPDCPPWRLLDEPEAEAAAPAVTPATSFTAPPVTLKGM